MNVGRRILAFIGLLAFAASVQAAENPRVLTWDDLIPAGPPLKSPIADLDDEVLDDLGYIARITSDLELGLTTTTSPDALRAQKLREKLAAAGVDFDVIEAAMDKHEAEIERRNSAVVEELNGEFVRLPGYALPFELNEDGVTEFLLVPYFGACIHTPPPPPNQMVFVKLGTESKFQNLFDPVWVTGRINVEPTTRALTFVDGEGTVATGYAVDGITVEPYE